jgi:RNA polymerase sigma factor (sigma-70 family)
MARQALQPLIYEHSDKLDWLGSNKAHAGDHNPTVAGHSSVRPLPWKELSLEQLLQLCLHTDQDVRWAEFVRRSQPTIARVVTKTIRRWIRPSRNLVDDLVQETYLKLCLNDFRALRQFVSRHENALFGFLKVVASNTVRDHFRGSYSRKRGSGMTEAQLNPTTRSTVRNSPSEMMERGILLQTIDKCLKIYIRTPNFPRDHAIFWLYYRHGMTAKTISGLPLIRLSVKGVESTISRMVHLVRLKFGTFERLKRH